jgi:hypothetical protein
VNDDQRGTREKEIDPRERASILAKRLPRFTQKGFEVVPTPDAVHKRLRVAYLMGLPHTRHEVSDLNYLTAGDPDFIDIGSLAYEMAAELQGIHEEWSQRDLEVVASYGLRIYRRGQVLGWHSDRADTHVISSIVHIEHVSDEPWPLHIEDHDGVEHEVCLEPGQMLLYESATCPHARPTPFAGEHYGSLFVHFRPLSGWDYTLEDIDELLQITNTEHE